LDAWIVEPNLVNRELIIRSLQSLGLEVLRFPDLAALVAALSRGLVPRIVVLSFGAGGYEPAQVSVVRRTLAVPATRLVAVISEPTLAHTSHLTDAGFDAVIIKPLSPRHLDQDLRTLLEAAS
jgi:DNA-binding response OmpR family regulator